MTAQWFIRILALILFVVCGGQIHAQTPDPAARSVQKEVRQPPGDGPGLLVEPELNIIDTVEYFQVIGGFMQSTDEMTVEVRLTNTTPAAILNTEIELHARPDRNISVLSGPVQVGTIQPHQPASALFQISTSETPPGLYWLDVSGQSSAGVIDARVVLFVASFEVDLDDMFDGQFRVIFDAPDGRYIASLAYDPATIFEPVTMTVVCPQNECITFIPNQPFAGIHPPDWGSMIDQVDPWVKKLLAGLVNFLGGNGVALGRDLARNGFGKQAVARAIKKIGLRGALRQAITKLTPGIGWIALAWGVATAIASAIMADPPPGDFFYVGQINTPPPPGLLTIREEACFQFSSCQTGPFVPTHIVGSRIYRRVLSDQSVLVYSEPVDMMVDTVLQIQASTDQPVYSVGETIVVEATVSHAVMGQLRGAEAVVTAAIRPWGTNADGAVLRDEAGTGTYTGTIDVTAEMVCSGGGPMQVNILAQRTTQGFMHALAPEFYVGMVDVPIELLPAAPMPDIAFHNILFVPFEAERGEEVFIDISFINAGVAPAPAVPWEIRLSDDPAGGTGASVLAAGMLDPMGSRQTSDVQVLVTIPPEIPFGEAYLLFIGDAGNTINECNNSNNVGIWPVDIIHPSCYPNCDGSTTAPILTVDDFTCFIDEFAAAQGLPPAQQIVHYANCDGSTMPPILTVDDFTCFINAFAQGCP